MKPRFLLIMFAASLLSVQARNYHVNFAKGNDNNDGTASAPFKHCPGDTKATANAASVALKPGDKVVFAGGVRYRGEIAIKSSGVAGRPIVFEGRAGRERAIVDGAERVRGWQKCKSEAEASGNPNWKEIYWAPCPEGVASLAWNLAEDGELLFLAETANPESQYMWNSKGYWKIPASKATRTSLTDPRIAPYGKALAGAYVQVYCRPNWIYFCRIKGFDPASNRLTFAQHSKVRKYYKEAAYSLSNHVLLIDRAGEFAVDEKAERVYLWPLKSGKIERKVITMSRRGTGFALENASHVTIRGFRIQQYSSATWGTAVRSEGGHHLTIEDNEMTMNRSVARWGVMNIHKTTETTIQNNHVHHNPYYRVTRTDGMSNSVIRGNVYDTNSGTACSLYRARNVKVSGNVIRNHRAVHSQGMAIYVNCDGITVEDNVFEKCSGITVQNSKNIMVRNNFFNSEGSLAIGLWTGTAQTVSIINNTMVGGAESGWQAGMSVFTNNGHQDSRWVIKNNILAGLGGRLKGDIGNNLFTHPKQYGKYKANNRLETKLETIFRDHKSGDYRQRKDGPAKGHGADLKKVKSGLASAKRLL